MELKSIYESKKQDYVAEILDKTDSMMAYLRRKHKQEYISTVLRRRVKNFTQLLHKIVDYPYKNYTKNDLLNLFLSFNGNVVESSWIEEKIKEL